MLRCLACFPFPSQQAVSVREGGALTEAESDPHLARIDPGHRPLQPEHRDCIAHHLDHARSALLHDLPDGGDDRWEFGQHLAGDKFIHGHAHNFCQARPAFIFSSSSATWSIDSSDPSCMPAPTIPARSATDWYSNCSTIFVWSPCASNVTVCSRT